MSVILNIRGTNGSGKTTLVRGIIAALGAGKPIRADFKEEVGSWYRRPDGSRVSILGKYGDTACGGLDASFSYKGAADDVMLFLGELAEEGDVVAEGVVALGSYGIGRLSKFAQEQEAKGNHVIFALLDTPLDECIRRCEARRAEKAAAKGKEAKPLNPENLQDKWEANRKDQTKLAALGLDTRFIPHQISLPTVLSWLGIK